jgi:hypothetical protein
MFSRNKENSNKSNEKSTDKIEWKNSELKYLNVNHENLINRAMHSQISPS